MDQVTKSEVQVNYSLITITTLILCLREKARKLLSQSHFVC